MTEARNDALADAVLDAWQSGAEVDFQIAADDATARAELLELEKAALLAAAATAAACASTEPMRKALFDRLVEVGRAVEKPAPPTMPLPAQPATARPPSTPRLLPFLLGAAAGIAVSFIAFAPKDEAAAEARLSEFLAQGQHARLEWKPGSSHAHGEVHGEVVWCTERQEGYLRIDGLEPLPEGRQYQLWIVDADRKGAPVDGGLFDLPSRAAKVVPIAAKLPVRDAKAFVVTVEPRGGVVVSDQSDVVAIASL